MSRRRDGVDNKGKGTDLFHKPNGVNGPAGALQASAFPSRLRAARLTRDFPVT